MFASTLLSYVALLASMTTALPSSNVDSSRDATPPTLDEFLSSPMTFEKRQTNSTSSALPDATVELCTEPAFKGQCVNATWPINQCIDLRGYAGLTESFMPKDGFDCLLMQGKCDASKPYAEVGDTDSKEGGDLTTFSWIKDFTSYMCFTEIEDLRRFVRVARLRVAGGRV